MLPLPQSALQSLTALPEDEFASRLAHLVPSLDGPTRADLLHALFPVPSATNEEATPPLVTLAIARVEAEGSLRLRAADFLLRRPMLLERLRRTPRAATRKLALLEAAAWVAVIVIVCIAGSRIFGARPVAEVPKASHGLLATQTTPLAPALELPVAARHRPSVAGVIAPSAQPQRNGATPARTTAVAHPRATPFHNIDFSGYFKHLRRRPQTVALQPRPSPVPSPTASPRPRVHSLFGPLFGPRGQ